MKKSQVTKNKRGYYYFENESFRYRVRSVKGKFILEIERHPWPKEKYYSVIKEFDSLAKAIKYLMN